MVKKKWSYYVWSLILIYNMSSRSCSVAPPSSTHLLRAGKEFSPCLWIITVFAECVSTNKPSLIHVPPLCQYDHIYFLCELLGEHIWGSGVNNVTICCWLLCCMSDVLVKKCLKRLCRDENYYPKIFSKCTRLEHKLFIQLVDKITIKNWNTISKFL